MRRKSANGLFFFFDRYCLGGAQRIHLDILKSIPDQDKQIFFTRYSPNEVFKREFYEIPHGGKWDIHFWCDHLLFRLFSVHYFSFYVNRHKSGQVFGANSTFFYDMLPFIKKGIVKTELLHNFTFGKNGMEFFGLANADLLTNRIVYDFYTRENIIKQYQEYKIDPVYLERLLFIEPGVDIPEKKEKKFEIPLRILCAGRGGPQKRIWLLNRISEYLININAPVIFHFAGPLISELSENVKSHAVVHGQISDVQIMNNLLSETDIALLTSAYEGFPMFVKESMAHGCIPLVTALPGNLMHLTDGVNALLIHDFMNEENVVKRAIEIIESMTHDSAFCKQISNAAYSYAAHHFSRIEFNYQYRILLTPAVI